ncbi:MAG: putative Helicase [Streblomastix strix]|uniref:Putative Helicase n=1 Tax=Streblomastix strix TaxID=222440 RepID=A0A5J4U6V9_9EUKA|nr:MAG: putative Helicase [Streblomastix strix]
MSKMLDILELFCSGYGFTYLRLDGGTPIDKRQPLMEKFNTTPRIFLFLLSTRSGGIGVNLTGADTVIFYDSDWNPAMDAQAEDRAHRIGQTREVHVYRLVSESTVEENILRRARWKRKLEKVVTRDGNFTHTGLLQRSDVCGFLGIDEKGRGMQQSISAGMKQNNEYEMQTHSGLMIKDFDNDAHEQENYINSDTRNKNNNIRNIDQQYHKQNYQQISSNYDETDKLKIIPIEELEDQSSDLIIPQVSQLSSSSNKQINSIHLSGKESDQMGSDVEQALLLAEDEDDRKAMARVERELNEDEFAFQAEFDEKIIEINPTPSPTPRKQTLEIDEQEEDDDDEENIQEDKLTDFDQLINELPPLQKYAVHFLLSQLI